MQLSDAEVNPLLLLDGAVSRICGPTGSMLWC
jgi:hypothetical protein